MSPAARAGGRGVRHRRDPAGEVAPTLPDRAPDRRPDGSAPARPASVGVQRGLSAIGAYCLVLAVLGGAVTVWPLLDGGPAGAQVLAGDAGGPAVPRAPVRTPGQAPATGPAAAVDPADVPAAALGRDAGGEAAFRPTSLVLPSGRSAQVLPSGVHADGSMVIPEDPSRVGWWDGGALAGEPFGSVVVAGHVDSRRYGVGFMAQMRRLRPGDVVVLADGASTRRYRIDALTQVPKARLAADADPFRQDVGHRLVLITCGGAYDRAAHRYPDNVVATAVPLG